MYSLKKVREICSKHGVILIFDEIISGFRVNLGGAQAEYGVLPDITCLGKAIGNGYPLSAVVGRKEIMKYMEEIFFSSTFGGETISLSAAIANIEKIEKNDVININKLAGRTLIKELNQVIDDLNLNRLLSVSDIEWWPQLILKQNNSDLYTSLLRQEFLKNGLLISNTFNLCYAHSNEGVLDNTIKKFRESVSVWKDYINSKNPEKYLRGDLIKKTFKVR